MHLLFTCSVVSNSLRPHGLQNTRLPCPSPTPGACSNSCPSSQWCHPTISSYHPFLLLSSVFPSIRVFSNESVLCIRWPKYGSFNFSISPFSEYSGLISLRIDWLDLLAVQEILNNLQHHSSNNYLASADCFQNSMLTNIQKGKCSCSWDGSDFRTYGLLGNTHRNIATLQAKLPPSSTMGPSLPVLQY